MSSSLATLARYAQNRLTQLRNYHKGNHIVENFFKMRNYLGFHILVHNMCDTLLSIVLAGEVCQALVSHPLDKIEPSLYVTI